MKTCRKCLETLDDSFFRKEKRVKDGLGSWCKPCTRKYNLVKRYGEGAVDHYEKTAYTQDGRCAICDAYPNKIRLALDHCHKSNKLRGLLCGACNTALERIESVEDFALKALKYLKEHE